MSADVPQVKIGKSPGTPLNAALSFWLPPNTPFGNLTKKHYKIVTRLDRVNALLQQIYQIHPVLLGTEIHIMNGYESYCYSIEEVIFHLRRAADEMISMYSLLMNFEKIGSYASQVSMDHIGALLHNEMTKSNPPFVEHLTLLGQLNEISNAFKHSFVNSDISLIGVLEPCVHALALKLNKLEKGIVFHNMALREVVEGYNNFYIEINSWLRGFSERHRDKG